MSLNTMLDKAMSELNVYEFKLFLYVFMQTTGVGREWTRIRQSEMEGKTGISHPTVLKYLKDLKGENEDEDGEAQRGVWVKVKKVTYPWAYGRLYAIGDDILDEYEG